MNFKIAIFRQQELILDSSRFFNEFRSISIDGNFIKLQIWDTAGQQRFRGITKSYYKGAQAIILVYDVNNSKSFEDIINFWLQ